MKKVALSLLALAAFGTLAFAEEKKTTAGTDLKSPVTASLSANGWGQVGADLDSGVVGFANGGEAKVTLWFLNGTNERTSDDIMHGYIEIKDIKVGLDDKAGGNDVGLSIGDITAKVQAGPLYVKLYGNTDPSVDYDFGGGDDNTAAVKDDTYYIYSGLYGGTETEFTVGDFAGYNTLSGAKGFEFGLDTGVLNIIGGVAAEGDWKSTLADGVSTDSATNDYEAYAKTEIILGEFLKLGVLANVGTTGTDAEGENGEVFANAGAEAYLNLLLLEGWAKANLETNTGDIWVAAAVQANVFDFIKAKVAVDAAVIAADPDVADDEGSIVAGAAATAFIDFGGLLGAKAGMELHDVLADDPVNTTVGIFAQADINLLGLKPYVKLSANTNLDPDSELNAFAKAGLEISWIPFTTVGAYLNTSDLLGTSTGDSMLGEAHVEVKVAY